MAGSACPIEIMRKVIQLMGPQEITIAYGQTEASARLSYVPPERLPIFVP
mgnify:CR=1 FL=1